MARSHSRKLTEKVSRIDDYLLVYLRNPTEDRLEYIRFLLEDWLKEAPNYSLDKANIAYEITPSQPNYSPLFPKEHYNEEREKEKAALQDARERYSEVARKLHEVTKRRSRKKEEDAEVQPSGPPSEEWEVLTGAGNKPRAKAISPQRAAAVAEREARRLAHAEMLAKRTARAAKRVTKLRSIEA
jgi:hypothetical protein